MLVNNHIFSCSSVSTEFRNRLPANVITLLNLCSDILVAEISSANIHHIAYCRIGSYAQRAQRMFKCCLISWVARVSWGWIERSISDYSALTTRYIEQSGVRWLRIRSRDIIETRAQIHRLPVPPYLVEPRVVQVEYRIARRGNRVGHLFQESIVSSVHGVLANLLHRQFLRGLRYAVGFVCRAMPPEMFRTYSMHQSPSETTRS